MRYILEDLPGAIETDGEGESKELQTICTTGLDR